MGPDLELCRLPEHLTEVDIETQLRSVLACAMLNLQAAGACRRDKAALVRWIGEGRTGK